MPAVEFDTTDFAVLERAREGLVDDILVALEGEGRAPHDSPQRERAACPLAAACSGLKSWERRPKRWLAEMMVN